MTTKYHTARKRIAEAADEFLGDYDDEIKDIILCDAPEARRKIQKLLVDFSEYLEPNDFV
jgi:hypothetical protein